jgi:hypothetical protein
MANHHFHNPTIIENRGTAIRVPRNGKALINCPRTADDFTIASLRPALCRVVQGRGIRLRALTPASAPRRRGAVVHPTPQDTSWFLLGTEAWRCGRFPADLPPYSAVGTGPDEASRNRPAHRKPRSDLPFRSSVDRRYPFFSRPCRSGYRLPALMRYP